MIKFIFKPLAEFSIKQKRDFCIKKIERHMPFYFKRKLPKDVSVIFITSNFSQKLNKRYRQKNKSANVLSFVYGREYAEIFITPARIRKEAAKLGESFKKRLVKMIIHGMIHCSGLDHERSPKEEKQFENLEKKLIGVFLP